MRLCACVLFGMCKYLCVTLNQIMFFVQRMCIDINVDYLPFQLISVRSIDGLNAWARDEVVTILPKL